MVFELDKVLNILVHNAVFATFFKILKIRFVVRGCEFFDVFFEFVFGHSRAVAFDAQHHVARQNDDTAGFGRLFKLLVITDVPAVLDRTKSDFRADVRAEVLVIFRQLCVKRGKPRALCPDFRRNRVGVFFRFRLACKKLFVVGKRDVHKLVLERFGARFRDNPYENRPCVRLSVGFSAADCQYVFDAVLFRAVRKLHRIHVGHDEDCLFDFFDDFSVVLGSDFDFGRAPFRCGNICKLPVSFKGYYVCAFDYFKVHVRVVIAFGICDVGDFRVIFLLDFVAFAVIIRRTHVKVIFGKLQREVRCADLSRNFFVRKFFVKRQGQYEFVFGNPFDSACRDAFGQSKVGYFKGVVFAFDEKFCRCRFVFHGDFRAVAFSVDRKARTVGIDVDLDGQNLFKPFSSFGTSNSNLRLARKQRLRHARDGVEFQNVIVADFFKYPCFSRKVFGVQFCGKYVFAAVYRNYVARDFITVDFGINS